MKFLPLQVVAALIALGLGIWAFSAALNVEAVQRGYDGVGMEHVATKSELRKLERDNDRPPFYQGGDATTNYGQFVSETMPEDDGGPRASEVYENVQVLGDLSAGQFAWLMVNITNWVAPVNSERWNQHPEGYQQGCNYCHVANLASDEKYTKHVSRRMIQMTQHLNENWGSHVQGAGVSCWTCHRGNNVPKNIWFDEAPDPNADRMVGGFSATNKAGMNVGLASLPNTPFSRFLNEDNNIRVIGPTALPTGNDRTIKQTEHTYGLMIHMSTALGVNCTYCHNSRSMAEWGQSPVTRTKAWYGIRMARNINAEYLEPLKERYPDYRLGPTGDAPKANCKTCHQGAFKPVLGKDMVSNYPMLAKVSDYQPEEDAEFQIVDGRIELAQPLSFEEGGSTLAEQSYETLDAISGLLGEVDESGRVEIRVGSETLAQERGEAVRVYIVEDRGVEGDRVVVVQRADDDAALKSDDGGAQDEVEFFIVGDDEEASDDVAETGDAPIQDSEADQR